MMTPLAPAPPAPDPACGAAISPAAGRRRAGVYRAAACVALGLLGIGACLPLPGGHVLGSKVVAAKAGSNTLVANDGTRCSVSDAAYEKARIGDAHTCAWSRQAGEGDRMRPPE